MLHEDKKHSHPEPIDLNIKLYGEGFRTMSVFIMLKDKLCANSSVNTIADKPVTNPVKFSYH